MEKCKRVSITKSRKMYNEGGYVSISDMEKSCNSKVEMNTMK